MKRKPMPKPLPCPWGRHKVTVEVNNDRWYCYCSSARCPATPFVEGRTEREAVEKWNKQDRD